MSVKRAAAVFVLLLAGLPAARAAGKPGDPIRLAVSPAGAPKPSLKHRLLPARADLAPGNAAAQYYRALALFFENSFLLKDIKEQYWHDWLETPLADLPRKDMAEHLQQARHLLREVELGARRRQCDWQLESRPEGIGLIVPDVQGYRSVGTVLAVRARLEIAEGRYDDAVRTFQTGYALARHLGQGPTLIHVLVGAAVAGLMDEQLDALLSRPDAPNLYWALTELPRPLLDPEPALEEDGRMLDNMFPWLKRFDGPALSQSEVDSALGELRKSYDDLGLVKQTEVERFAQAAQLLQAHGESKKRLLARGNYTAEQVEAMPLFQAVALSAYLDYREAYDEMAKWAHAPNGLRQPGYKKAAEQYGAAVGRLDRLFFRGVFQDLSGGGEYLSKVYGAAERADRRLAALTCVEALRIHAARNGKWPAALDDLTDAPAPADPVTGKPFEYAVNDGVAVLSAPPISGVKGTATSAVKYELTLRK
jgi:hypothetical protein